MQQASDNYITQENNPDPKSLTFGTSENVMNSEWKDGADIKLKSFKPLSSNQSNSDSGMGLSYKDYAQSEYDVSDSISKNRVTSFDNDSRLDDGVDYYMMGVYGQEATRAAAQSGWDTTGNAIVKFGVTAITTAADVIIGDLFGLGQGIIQGVAKGSWEAAVDGFMNNEFSKLMFDAKESTNEAFTNYYTQEEQFEKDNGGFLGTIKQGNFWADDVFVNMGFSVGIGLGLAVGKGVGMNTIGKFMKLGKSADIVETGAKNLVKAGKFESLKDARSFIRNGQVSPEINISSDLMTAAKHANNGNRLINGTASFTAASSEARMESLDLAKQLDQEFDMYINSEAGQFAVASEAYNRVMEQNGLSEKASINATLQRAKERNLPAEILEQINNEKKKVQEELGKSKTKASIYAQLGAYIGNFPILLASNAVMYGKGIVQSTGKTGSTLGKLSQKLGVTPKNSGKYATLISKTKDGKHLITNWKANKWVQGTSRVIEKTGTEALEEVSQQYVSDINNLRFTDAMNGISMDIVGYKYQPDAQELGGAFLGKTWNAMVQSFGKTFSNKDTWVQGFVGAITGGIGKVVNGQRVVNAIRGKERINGENWGSLLQIGIVDAIKEGNLHAKMAKSVVDRLNPIYEKYQDPNFINNIGAHYLIEAEKQAAVEEGNKKNINDLILKQAISDLQLFQEAGYHNEYLDILSESISFAERITFSDNNRLSESDYKLKQDTIKTLKETLGAEASSLTDDVLFDDYSYNLRKVYDKTRKFIDVRRNIESLVGNDKNEDYVTELSYKFFMVENWEDINNSLSEDLSENWSDIRSTLIQLKDSEGSPVLKKISNDLDIDLYDTNISPDLATKIINYLITEKTTNDVVGDLAKKVLEKTEDEQINNVYKELTGTEVQKKAPLFFSVLASIENPTIVESLYEYFNNSIGIANYKRQLSAMTKINTESYVEFFGAVNDIQEAVYEAVTVDDTINNLRETGSFQNATYKAITGIPVTGNAIYQKAYELFNNYSSVLKRLKLEDDKVVLKELIQELERLRTYIVIYNALNEYAKVLTGNNDPSLQNLIENINITMRLMNHRLKGINTTSTDGVKELISYFTAIPSNEVLSKIFESKNIDEQVTSADIAQVFENKDFASDLSMVLESTIKTYDKIRTELGLNEKTPAVATSGNSSNSPSNPINSDTPSTGANPVSSKPGDEVSEDTTGDENTASTISKFMERLSSDQELVDKNSTTGTHYTILKRLFRRVSQVLPNNFTGDTSLYANSRNAGTTVDTIGRLFFQGISIDEIKNTEVKFEDGSTNLVVNVISDTAFNAIIKKLNSIQKVIDQSGERFLTNNLVVFDEETNIAGEIDILSVNDKTGEIRIYDFKTSTKKSWASYNTKYNGLSKKDGHARQLSMYKAMLEKRYEIKVKSIEIIPFEIEYDTYGNIEKAYDPKGQTKLRSVDNNSFTGHKLAYNEAIVREYLKPSEGTVPTTSSKLTPTLDAAEEAKKAEEAKRKKQEEEEQDRLRAESKKSVSKNDLIRVENGVAIVSEKAILNAVSIDNETLIESTFSLSQTPPKDESNAIAMAYWNTFEYLRMKGVFNKIQSGRYKKNMGVYVGYNRDLANISTKNNTGFPEAYMGVYVKIDGVFELIGTFPHGNDKNGKEKLKGALPEFTDFLTEMHNSEYNEVIIDKPVGTINEFVNVKFPMLTRFNFATNTTTYDRVLFKESDNTDSSFSQIKNFDIHGNDVAIYYVDTKGGQRIYGKSVDLPTSILKSFNNLENIGQIAVVIVHPITKVPVHMFLNINTMNGLNETSPYREIVKGMVDHHLRKDLIKMINQKPTEKDNGQVTPLYLNLADSDVNNILYFQYQADANGEVSNGRTARPMFKMQIKKDKDGNMTLEMHQYNYYTNIYEPYRTGSEAIKLGKGIGIETEELSLDTNEITSSVSTVSDTEIEAIITKAIDSIMAEDVRFNITGKTTLDEIKQMSNMGMITSAIDNVINPNFKIQIKVNRLNEGRVSIDPVNRSEQFEEAEQEDVDKSTSEETQDSTDSTVTAPTPTTFETSIMTTAQKLFNIISRDNKLIIEAGIAKGMTENQIIELIAGYIATPGNKITPANIKTYLQTTFNCK